MTSRKGDNQRDDDDRKDDERDESADSSDKTENEGDAENNERDDDSDEPLPPTTVHVGRAIEGDKISQGWLVERLSPFLLRRAHDLLRKHDPAKSTGVDAEDIVEDTWLVQCRNWGRLQERGGRRTPTMISYLQSTVTQTTLALITKAGNSRRREISGDSGNLNDTVLITPGYSRSELRDLIRREAEGEILARINGLSDAERLLFYRYFVEEEKASDIAADIGGRPETLRRRCSRILDKLRDGLDKSVFDEFRVK